MTSFHAGPVARTRNATHVRIKEMLKDGVATIVRSEEYGLILDWGGFHYRITNGEGVRKVKFACPEDRDMSNIVLNSIEAIWLCKHLDIIVMQTAVGPYHWNHHAKQMWYHSSNAPVPEEYGIMETDKIADYAWSIYGLITSHPTRSSYTSHLFPYDYDTLCSNNTRRRRQHGICTT